jgi:uncharacterized protein
VKWLRRAADQGNAVAQYNLGAMYAKPQDYVQAHMWASLASRSTKEIRDMAVGPLNFLASKMTPEQIAEAQKLARDWKPKLPV